MTQRQSARMMCPFAQTWNLGEGIYCSQDLKAGSPCCTPSRSMECEIRTCTSGYANRSWWLAATCILRIHIPLENAFKTTAGCCIREKSTFMCRLLNVSEGPVNCVNRYLGRVLARSWLLRSQTAVRARRSLRLAPHAALSAILRASSLPRQRSQAAPRRSAPTPHERMLAPGHPPM